ncbi:LuxR family transcriptional regulator [Streptomyces triticagri]|uniref:LuxR family transcriptional regulator n=2 Tax=Streptomyces triticagri TaxID=2293568 RepID=A0A372LXA1_9ACTN|nr:LuxR family transcriptional regulator [Streptomyces triticagri]
MDKTGSLDGEAQDVYRAMLTHRQEGVAALAERLAMPEERVRAALDRLSDLDVVRPCGQSPDVLLPVSPGVGMEALLAEQQAELAAQQQRLEATRALAARLAADYNSLRPYESDGQVQLVVGLEEVRARLAALTREVQQEVLTFAPDGAQSAENRSAAQPLNQQLLDRGVSMRTVYLDSVRNSPPTIAHAARLAEYGGEVRTTAALPTRLIIVDRRVAVLPVDADDTAKGAVILSGDGVLTAVCALFELVWESARPLVQTVHRDDGELTGQERVLLRMLAEGYTDEVVAKRLGVSSRTARRLASGLMERLDARSRFQAGVTAVRRGWLSED